MQAEILTVLKQFKLTFPLSAINFIMYPSMTFVHIVCFYNQWWHTTHFWVTLKTTDYSILLFLLSWLGIVWQLPPSAMFIVFGRFRNYLICKPIGTLACGLHQSGSRCRGLWLDGPHVNMSLNEESHALRPTWNLSARHVNSTCCKLFDATQKSSGSN